MSDGKILFKNSPESRVFLYKPKEPSTRDEDMEISHFLLDNRSIIFSSQTSVTGNSQATSIASSAHLLSNNLPLTSVRNTSTHGSVTV